MALAAVEKDLRNSVEFIPDRLYYVALGSTPPSQNPKRHFFSIDTELIYWNFFLDFGPLNFGQLYRFCERLNRKLADPKLRDRTIYFYSSTHSHKRANAAFLISAWSILYQGRTPDEAFLPFKNYSPPFPPWHDATPTICTFQLTILDTLRGLYKARECRFFSLETFNIDEYEHYEQVENGDLNWCVDGKFIAFAGPHATREMSAGGYHTLCPSDYIPYFKKRNVTLVVRLNKKYYPAESFLAHGIDHVELEFLDGSNPPDFILAKFIEKCEQTPGAVAVHCKAGLGRTGSCIGAYMMKHHRFTAEEAIGWMRIVRPGMVIGPQQQWMRDMQFRMWQEGEVFYAKLSHPSNNLPLPQVVGSNRATPRHSILNARAQHQYADLPAMEEKSTFVAKDEAESDKASQGDLLRVRREQQHKQHFPIEPSLTSISMKVPNAIVGHNSTTGLRSSSVARAGASTLSRPNTPGTGATTQTSISTRVPQVPGAILNHPTVQGADHNGGRILRAPGLQSVGNTYNSNTTANAASPVLSGGHAAISIGSSTPKSSSGTPSPNTTRANNTFTTFFGTWRSQG